MLSGNLEISVGHLREKLNALVICLSHSWGGLEQVAAHDAMEMEAQGLKIQVLCLQDSPIHRHLSSRSSLELIPLTFRPRNTLDFKLRKVLRKLIRDGVNLIHTHQPTLLGAIVPWLKPFPEVALLATRHIMNDHSKRDLFHRLIYARLDALIVMSQTLRTNVIQTHAIREKKVKVVNLGLDYERFDPDKVNAVAKRSVWGADPSTTVIGMVGRIDPDKGQSTFIRAAAGLMKKLHSSEKLKFIIVGEETLGSTSDYLQELTEIVRQFHMEDHILFAGYQENIPEIMQAFDIFVMPSRQEAFGLVAIEAMAMECPIVISNSGSAEEIVGHEEFGLTIRPHDAFDLQTQLRYLLDRPELRFEMGKRARLHVMKHYDRRIRLQKTLGLYDRALRRSEIRPTFWR